MATSPSKKPRRTPDAIVIPLAAERLQATKETETRTVRIEKSVRFRDAEIDQLLRSDEVAIERVPIGRFVDEPVPDRFEGDTLVMSVMEEVPVVRLRVKEELRIRRKKVTKNDRRTVRLRTEEATVERQKPRRRHEKGEMR